MKTANQQGTIKNLVKIGSMVSFDTEVISSRGVEKASYTVTCTQTSDVYRVAKFEKGDIVSTYTVDTWNGECDCKGWQNGFLCRHIKMVRALEADKIL